MKKSSVMNIKVFFVLTLLLIVTRMIPQLPWWSFVVPVILFGTFVSSRKWHVRGFIIGFISGFITWLMADIIFDTLYQGAMLDKIGLLLGVPKVLVFIISGVIGGLLTGLAFYTGTSMIARERITSVE